MSDSLRNSMRLIFDMQACQAPGSASRGVGRYSCALFEAVASLAPPREVRAFASPAAVGACGMLRRHSGRMLSMPDYPELQSNNSVDGGVQDLLRDSALTACLQRLKPDVVHVSHVFEGYCDPIALHNPLQGPGTQVASATLYDFIPLIYKDHYLKDKRFRRWYYARLAWLRRADLLLSISDCTRSDAINLMGIDPSRIVTIWGGVSEMFRPPLDTAGAKRRLAEHFRLRDRIVLYTGGDDYRKNIAGLLRAFALIPAKERQDTQLVVVCSMSPERKKSYLRQAVACGLDREDVVFTGFVSEQSLVDFYGVCDVFIFPSYYEGLGLPVIEAMACGAPVIGSGTSSIRELIARDDAMFNPHDDGSMADALHRVLRTPGLAAQLRAYGLERAKRFTWTQSARTVLAAFDEALARKRSSGLHAVSSRSSACKRLAVLTPLPPTKSGIADYNAAFLPYLSRHFEIDVYTDCPAANDDALLSSVTVCDVKSFEKVAHLYDYILYDIGNSEFHVHMLPLLERFPGAVCLHDAYLSGLHGYIDFNLGNFGHYEQEMLASHGPMARKHFSAQLRHEKSVYESMVELPCTKRVLDKALGVISHSPFNLNLARSFYPEGWPAPYRTIPQMVAVPPPMEREAMLQLRAEFGYAPDDFLIVTFGHIAWTKLGDRLLEAFLNSSVLLQGGGYLIFVGQLAKDDYGRTLMTMLSRSKHASRVKITGYLCEEEYKKYQRIADIGVQLRTKSRGGTPKGVLDCLAYGLPVMVNNAYSFSDYSDDVVIKLSPDPAVAEITTRLEAFHADRATLERYGVRGREYVVQEHDPVRCAAQYAAALHEFKEMALAGESERTQAALAPLLACSDDPPSDAARLVNWLRTVPEPDWKRRRLYVDVSHIAKSDHATGIQRVVKEIVTALYSGDFVGVDPLAVELIDGELVEARDWLRARNLLAESEIAAPKAVARFRPGDVLLMLDSSWEQHDKFTPVFQAARAVGVPIVTAVYDILPICLPEGNFVEGGREWFEGWFRKALSQSDALLCISRSVADQVRAYIQANSPEHVSLAVDFWHLGADFESHEGDACGNERVAVVPAQPYLLSIGTIEPRKSHALMLDAMERFWAEGGDTALCLAGKIGWMVADLVERIRNHPEMGRRLFFVENPSDAEVRSLYTGASALLFLSIGEGFGLPLVEAAHYGIPILCTDIPVFHEIAGEFATYLELGSAQALCRGIQVWRRRQAEGRLPDTRDMPYLSWRQSAAQLLSVVMGENHVWRKQ